MKKKSRILDMVHETPSDLHKLGVINKKKMAQYDALCIPPVPDYTPDAIRSLRERYHISQSVMASVLNTSLSTVQKWEGRSSIQVDLHKSCSISLIAKVWK